MKASDVVINVEESDGAASDDSITSKLSDEEASLKEDASGMFDDDKFVGAVGAGVSRLAVIGLKITVPEVSVDIVDSVVNGLEWEDEAAVDKDEFGGDTENMEIFSFILPFYLLYILMYKR